MSTMNYKCFRTRSLKMEEDITSRIVYRIIVKDIISREKTKYTFEEYKALHPMMGDCELFDSMRKHDVLLDVLDEPKEPPATAPAADSDGVLHLFFQTLTGKIIRLDNVNSNETIYNVKLIIQGSQGIPPDVQRLVMAGQQLDDGKTLQDYDVQSGTTINLVLRLAGGMFTEVSGRDGRYKPISMLPIFNLDNDTFITGEPIGEPR